MLRAVIVDDEPLAINLLKLLLDNTGKIQCVGAYCRPKEAIEQIRLLTPDAVFLDVEMPGINGLELAGDILDRSADIDIVFVTAYRDYAVEAFELNAVDYLLKPALQENVDRAVSRLLTLRRQRGPASPQAARARIIGFGQFEVRTAGGQTLKWRTSKAEELFAYLLYHRGTLVRKGQIIDTLWPECEPKNADTNLHTSVYNLKKTLKESGIPITVKFSGGSYALELGPAVEYDVAAFETYAAGRTVPAGENIAECEAIIALYQGDYLEGKEYLWCITERARLQKYFAELVKQTARFHIHAARYSQAEGLLLRNVAYVPYDEDAYELLLQVCALRGDRPAMIQYYETLQALLQQDLDIEPRPSLKRLYESLMNDV